MFHNVKADRCGDPPARGPGPLLWLILHGGVLLALGLSVLLGRTPALDTDLLGLLPPSSAAYAGADRILQERSSRNVAILSGNEDFDRAREEAAILYHRLSGADGLFEELSLFVDETAAADFAAYLRQYRYMLLDPAAAALLEEGRAAALAEAALGRAYGAFTLANLDLESDPFLLAEGALRRFLESPLLRGGLAPRDGVLTASFEGKHYVLLRGILSGTAVSLGTERVGDIYRAAAEQDTGEFVFSGFPFHSYESASRARREITLLSAATLLVLLILFLRIFRSPLPALLIILAAAASILLGLCAAFVVFRTIHILTLVFGTSLIGFSVDYSIHFFVQRRTGLDGRAVRSALFRGISLSFVSSVLCFLVFLFAPFGILRQFAVFLTAGLVSSWATVFCLFPRLPRQANLPRQAVVPGQAGAPEKTAPPFFRRTVRPGLRRIAPAVLAALVLALSGTLAFHFRSLSIRNDLRGLYSAPPELVEWERIASAVLDYRAGGFYVMVSGADQQEALENEERFLARLHEAGAGTFAAASLIAPPAATQERRFRSAAALLPLAEAQYRALGFPPEEASRAAESLERDYAAAAGRYVLPSNVPPQAAALLAGLTIGPAGGRWYQALLPLGAVDQKTIVSLANDYDFVFPVDKGAAVSSELDALTLAMFKLLAAAAGLVLLGAALYYRNIAGTLRTALVPVMAALASLAVHAALGLPLSFFSAAGFILVLGLGLDYLFYLAEDRSKDGAGTTALAVALSWVTTVLSFGALAFSSFAPVRLFALAVVPGLSAAFVSAMIARHWYPPRRGNSGPHGGGSRPGGAIPAAAVFTALFTAAVFLFASCGTEQSAGNYGPVLAAPGVNFRLLPPGDIEKKIDAAHRWSGVYGTNRFTFNVWVRADEREIVMELFNEMGNTLGTLHYDGTDLRLDSSWFPKNLKAEYAVADFQFCFYRIESLRAALPALTLEAEPLGTDGETRRFYRGETLIIEIEKTPRRVRYVNHPRNYSYTIEGDFS